MMTITKLPRSHCILRPMAGSQRAAVGTKPVPMGDGASLRAPGPARGLRWPRASTCRRASAADLLQMLLPAFADPIRDCGLRQSAGAFSVDRPVNRGFKEGVAIGLEQAKRSLTTQVRWSSDTGEFLKAVLTFGFPRAASSVSRCPPRTADFSNAYLGARLGARPLRRSSLRLCTGSISYYQLVGIICGSRNLETVLPISAANPLPTPFWLRKTAQNSAVGRLGESYSNPLYPMIICHRSGDFRAPKRVFPLPSEEIPQGPPWVISPRRSSLAQHADVRRTRPLPIR